MSDETFGIIALIFMAGVLAALIIDKLDAILAELRKSEEKKP